MSPRRKKSKVEKVAPRSAGSLTAAVKAAGSALRIASKSVSTPGASRVIAVGQVAGELVVTTSPESRSHQALWRMRWWPGRTPVMSDVWLASVTVGMPAMAP